MVGGHRDTEERGVYSLFKEAGRLLYQHVQILRPFLLAFLVPMALVLCLEVIGIAWVLASVAWLAQLVRPHRLEGILGHYHDRHSGFHGAFHAAFLKAPTPFQSKLYPLIIELIPLTSILTFLILFVTWVLVNLTTTVVAKAIHHICSQNTTSFEEYSLASFYTLTLTLIRSIFTTLFHFVYPIFIISLCFLIVHIFTYVILALPFYLFSGPQLFPYPLETINIHFSYFFFLVLDSWFEVSTQVIMPEVY